MGAQSLEFDPWGLTVRGLPPADQLGIPESLLTVSNGSIGIRGVLDEGDPAHARGTFIAGVHEEFPFTYPEKGYGNPETGQAIVPVTDGSILRALVDGTPLRGDTAQDQTRRLDLRAGTLHREAVWTTRAGGRVRLDSTRVVPLDRPGLAAICYRLTALDRPARVVVRSELVANAIDGELDNDDPHAAKDLHDALAAVLGRTTERGGVLVHHTRQSGMTVAAAVHHALLEGAVDCVVERSSDLLAVDVVSDLAPGESLTLVKLLGYAWSGPHADEVAPAAEQLAAVASAVIADARERGWEGLLVDQRASLDRFWAGAEVEIEGDPELELALRFDLFQLLQGAATLEGAPMGAKALTGSGYDGHTFWDIEGFVLPTLSFLAPAAAQRLLGWRARTLPRARERAGVLGLSGATFPWRTINGSEASGYWPASSAAQHLNAAIARAFAVHGRITGTGVSPDGVAVLVGTARAWIDMGHWDHEGRWHLFGMTGPDEYTGVVDDNTFTNLMAARNLRWAADACRAAPDAAAHLEVDEDEVMGWLTAAGAAYVPWDEILRVHPACENFTTYGEWDFESGPVKDIQSQAHYAKIYRRQVVKQADLVQALWWCEDAFTEEEIARDFDYYERRTVRDSSLSAGPQAVIAARTGHLDLAYAYLRTAALVDLRDIQGDTAEGLHLASLAGAWLALVCGFGGVREEAETLALAPRLPSRLARLAFRLRHRDRVFRIEIARTGTTVEILEGEGAVDILLDGNPRTVSPGEPLRVRLESPEPLLDPPRQPPGREPSA